MSGRFIDDQDVPQKSQKAKHGLRRSKEDKYKRKKAAQDEKETKKHEKWA